MATNETLTRRHFAALCAASGLLPLAPLAAASGIPAFLSAFRDEHGQYGVAALGEDGKIVFKERLPARGHDTVVSPAASTAVTFARRPGRFALVFDLQRRVPSFAFEASAGRHFYGHGFFSSDGRLLFATENDYDGEAGVVGIYDVAAQYRRIGEFQTHGIGPHEALLLRDGRTIAVANGGILTHPDFPRQKLNLASMAPSLSYIDLNTGDLLDQVSPPSERHQLSIRHIDQANDGTVWFGGQYEGIATDTVPLIGRHQRGQPLEFIDLPRQITNSFRQYIGSIKANRGTNEIAITSPRGGLIAVLDSTERTLLHTHRLEDVCGIAPSGFSFANTAAAGFSLDRVVTGGGLLWDNHLRPARA